MFHVEHLLIMFCNKAYTKETWNELELEKWYYTEH